MSKSSPDTPWRPDQIVVGRIGRAHGLDGSVYLEGHGGVVPLRPGTTITVGERPATIRDRRGTAERPILRLDLAATREAAEQLRGLAVSVPSSQLPQPEPDEYFHVDLIGCQVYAGERLLGEVIEVLAYPANDVLDVRGGETSLLLPLAADAILEVDVAARRIHVREDML